LHLVGDAVGGNVEMGKAKGKMGKTEVAAIQLYGG